MEPQPTASQQSTLKLEICLLWDPNLGPSSPSRAQALPVLPLGKLPKRLGPQVKVTQVGSCVLMKFLVHRMVKARMHEISFLKVHF